VAADVTHSLRIVKELAANMDESDFFLNINLVVNSKSPAKRHTRVIYDDEEEEDIDSDDYKSTPTATTNSNATTYTTDSTPEHTKAVYITCLRPIVDVLNTL
jgi:hypothetical protein